MNFTFDPVIILLSFELKINPVITSVCPFTTYYGLKRFFKSQIDTV